MKCSSRYKAQRIIGQGAFGTVLLASDAKTKKQVALKVLTFFDEDDPKSRAEFLEEARRLGQLHHEAIVPVEAFCEDGYAPYFVMPLFAGSLQAKLDTLGKVTLFGYKQDFLPLPKVAEVLLRLASAFDYLHASGFVHMDIKPDNVLLDKQGRAFLSDLGLSAAYGERLSGPRGNPLYMAPELRGGGRASAASDLYGLALMAYYLLFADYPKDKSLDEFFALWKANEVKGHKIPMPKEPRVTPAMVRRARPGLPANALAKFFSKALANDPQKRFPTAEVMVDQLLDILANPEAK